MKRYYHCVVKEINGEQEYSYDYLVEAENLTEAKRIAAVFARRFYSDTPVISDDGYIFFDTIWVGVESLTETTKEKFIEDIICGLTLTAALAAER